MNLQAIVAVSGKPGLWKALIQNKSGFILESLDAQKTKMVANLSTAKMAALDEITVFGEDDDIKLTDILERMKTSGKVPDAKADGKALRSFFREVAPDHDEERVYSSDIKKIITWYNILKDLPLFNEEAKQAVAEEAVVEETPVAEAQPEAPAKRII
jgi:3-hydroxyisobutyrate dehydrogenase-like beta-hydroxyacid dehydrogenase